MKKIYHIAVAIFGAALWLFFALCCYGQLHSVEGDSLFLFTGEFAKDVLIQKGGLSKLYRCFHRPVFQHAMAGIAYFELDALRYGTVSRPPLPL